VRGSRVSAAVLLSALGALAGSLLGGCGGTSQDAGEPSGSFPIQILRVSFPRRQAIPSGTRLALTVRNVGPRTIPNLAVTVDSFSYTSPYPGLADPKRPVWIIDEGPGARPVRSAESARLDPAGAGQTAYVNTWALGPLRPGGIRTFRWRLTPVTAGLHRVSFLFAAGLAGRARAVFTNGRPARGRILVHIAPAPPATHVDPETGRVVPGPAS
jgi:hypothetical protein